MFKNLRKRILMDADGVNIGGTAASTVENPSNTDPANNGDNKDANNNPANNPVSDKEANQEKTFTQAEVDKIVEKRLNRERAKVKEQQDEATKLANMTDAEKKEYEYNKKIADLEAKQAEFAKKELKQTALGILTDKGYSMETAKSLSEYLDYTDADKCKASIDNIKSVLDKCVEAEVDRRMKTKTVPKSDGSNKGAITWDEVVKNPSLLSAYTKQQKK